jgi:hypothetical protein
MSVSDASEGQLFEVDDPDAARIDDPVPWCEVPVTRHPSRLRQPVQGAGACQGEVELGRSEEAFTRRAQFSTSACLAAAISSKGPNDSASSSLRNTEPAP